jgi:hypothetical protein
VELDEQEHQVSALLLEPGVRSLRVSSAPKANITKDTFRSVPIRLAGGAGVPVQLKREA